MTPTPPRPAPRALSLVVALVFAALGAAPAFAQDSEICLSCHEDRELTGTRNGKKISVFVDAKQFASSVHKDLDCSLCHMDASAEEIPHADDLERVDCGNCHPQEKQDHVSSAHGKAAAKRDPLAPTCVQCHGKHNILPRSDTRSPVNTINIPSMCGRCHHEGSPVSLAHQEIAEDRILENYSESIHGEGLFKKGLTVTAVCTSCHTPHRVLPHTDEKSSVHRTNVAATCTRCHSRIEEVHQKVIEGRLWEQAPHQIPSCTDCHSPHKIRRAPTAQGMSTADCLRCHADPNLTMVRAGKTISIAVDEAKYNSSTHARVACAQCHSEVKSSLHRPCETIESKVNCAVCHAEVVEIYQSSIHGTLAAKSDPDAPQCLDCHDKHFTTSKRWPESRTYPRNVPQLCATCHRQGEKAAVRIKMEEPRDIVQSYETSIHGVGLIQSGLVVTATCADCHTAHGEQPPADPRSTVNPANLANTCAKCHHGIVEVFRASVHWPGNVETDRKVPTCEDCHSSHSISRTDLPDFRFTMMQQCGRCHESEAETFFTTYHGKVTQLGSAGAAKCYDCHGTHDILPIDNPLSHLSRDNVVATCAKCHPGSNRRFAGYLTHATHHERSRYPYLFYAFWFMTTLLVGTLTFATAHTGAWLWRLWRTREAWRHHKAAAAAVTGKQYLRFTAAQRVMHIVMLISFFTLALTGMALKFSYMSWAQAVTHLFGGSEAMGFLHRVGAVALIALFAVHLRDLWRLRRSSGKGWLGFIFSPESMMFGLKDIKDVWASIKWFIGVGERPQYGRYTYWEKFDYFAVFWGVLVIGSTGLVLWFPTIFTRVLPGWSINVATIIHSDEALLAVGFIFTIHFFNTHFRPDKFPMDPVIFTGRVSIDELKYDKPEEYEKMIANGQLEGRLVEPMSKNLEKAFRIFGFTALTIGLTLIAAILYTMVFGYR